MRIRSILWEILGFPGSQQGHRRRPGQSHDHSNYETSGHSKRVEELLGKSLIYPEIHSWIDINHLCLHQVAQKGAKFQVGGRAANDLQKATTDNDEPPHGTCPYQRPLLLYLATNSYAISALITQEDGSGAEQPIYYISRALKDAETHYPRAERACLAILYGSQRLRHCFLAYEVWLMTKSHAIKALLQQPILSGRISQWLLQLSQ